jgi:hypothetical protein
VGCQYKGRKSCRRLRTTTVDGIGLCDLHAADWLFQRYIRESGPCYAAREDTHTCAGGMQAAHVWSRRYKAIRWDEANCIPLCAGAHHFYTLRPAEWAEACERWGIDYEGLRRRALNDPPMHAAEVWQRYEAGR